MRQAARLVVPLALAVLAAHLELAASLPATADGVVAADGSVLSPADSDSPVPADAPARLGPAHGVAPPAPGAIMRDVDTNSDGKISHSELTARLKLVHEQRCAQGPSVAVSAHEMSASARRAYG